MIPDVFFISPVRGLDPDTEEKTRAYVESLERQGKKVHWPKRDTDQNDPVGIRICRDNFAKIIQAQEIHFWYYRKEPCSACGTGAKSEGSIFDFGGVFMLLILALRSPKKFVLANVDEIEKYAKPGEKSFENVLLALHRGEHVSVKIYEKLKGSKRGN